MLAEEKSTKELFAIKVLKKRFIIDNNELERQGIPRQDHSTDFKISPQFAIREKYLSGGQPRETSIFGGSGVLLPDRLACLLCDAICGWWRLDVAHSA